MEIYLVRHGITESNKKKIYMGWSEEGLSPEGRKQAGALGKSLQSLVIHRIYTSPLRRAVETSEIINQSLSVPISVEEDLTEMRLGSWEGLTEDEVSKRFPDDYQVWNSRPAGFILQGRETLAEVQNRTLNAIQKIKEGNDEFPVLVVTHVAIVRCLIIHYQRLDINFYRRIDVPNASVFRLRLDGDSGHITRFL